MTGGMKKLIFCQIGLIVFLFGLVFFWTQILMLLFALFGAVPVYTKQGPVQIQSGDKIIAASVYTRQGAPYVLVGPYRFPERKDYFFVRKDEVVGRCLDEKIEGDSIRLFKWLLIGLDLSDDLDAMAPCYSFQAEIRHNKTKAKYNYRVNLAESGAPPREVSFSVDEKWLK